MFYGRFIHGVRTKNKTYALFAAVCVRVCLFVCLCVFVCMRVCVCVLIAKMHMFKMNQALIV